MSVYFIDIDGTICNKFSDQTYDQSVPFTDRIAHFNSLYDQGHEIHYWTARGGHSKIDHTELTHKQLSDWGVKFTSLKMGKPSYDYWIDDKAQNVDSYFDNELAKDLETISQLDLL
jgi:hypothetical protein